MKAVVYEGPCQVAVQDVPDPKIEQPTDAVVKMTSTAICGSDLHMYEGRTAAQPGLVFGHEPMGIVEEVGPAVQSIKKGDRVVMPFNIACGFCFNCLRGFFNACLTTNPNKPSAAFGYVDMGPYRGGQAEYLRVPIADMNTCKLPGQPGDSMENDFVLLADIFPTGYHATKLAQVTSGDTVAVFGAGPVGLMSAYSALLEGASQVFVVDRSQARLQKAKDIGCIPINYQDGDPVQQILDMRANNPEIQQETRANNDEKKMPGVMCGIDAVGYESFDWEHSDEQQPNRVLNDLIRLVNPTGAIGVIGVYLPQDPGGVNEQAKHGEFPIAFGELWDKGLQVGTGQAPVKRYQEYLRDLIVTGKAKPSFVVSETLPLDSAPDAYKQFDKRDDWTKVILKPAQA